MAERSRRLYWSWLTSLVLTYWLKTKRHLMYWLTLWVWTPLVARLRRNGYTGVENEAMSGARDPYTVSSGGADACPIRLEALDGPCGLVNIGNFCFVNAVLQCLATVPGFVESVDRALRTRNQLYSSPLGDDNHEKKVAVAATLVGLLQSIGQDADSDVEREAEVEEDRPSRVNRDDTQQQLRTFRLAASRCTYLMSSAASRQQQQDAEEFLSFLLELLHDLLRVPAQPNRQEEEQQRFLQSEDWFLQQLKSYDPNDPRSYTQAVANIGDVRWNYFLRQNASVITELFSAQTVRGSQCCSCANLTCLHEEQRIFSLAIGVGKEDQTLAGCLERFRHPEQLTGENRVYCDGYCRAKTTRLTQILLQRVPPVLVFQLQRFKHTSLKRQTEKVDTPVSFPCGKDELLDITMNAFIREDESRVIFELTAVCAHVGSSIDSGHYVAYVRHEHVRQDAVRSEQWFRIDDEVVSAIDEAQLRQETLCSAYLLFYAQVPRRGDGH